MERFRHLRNKLICGIKLHFLLEFLRFYFPTNLTYVFDFSNSLNSILSQRRQRTRRDRSHRTAGYVSGSWYTATCQRRCHIGRFSVPAEFSEFLEQSSSQYKPTDEHTEHSKLIRRTGNYEVRAEEDDQRVEDKGEGWFTWSLRYWRILFGHNFLSLLNDSLSSTSNFQISWIFFLRIIN